MLFLACLSGNYGVTVDIVCIKMVSKIDTKQSKQGVRMLCCKLGGGGNLGQVSQNLISTNPGLTVNRAYELS